MKAILWQPGVPRELQQIRSRLEYEMELVRIYQQDLQRAVKWNAANPGAAYAANPRWEEEHIGHILEDHINNLQDIIKEARRTPAFQYLQQRRRGLAYRPR